MEPVYLKTQARGVLAQRIEVLRRRMGECRICPRECGVDRFQGRAGVCRTGSEPIVSSFNPHFGEESPLVGQGGSGTIFFTNCNLGCLFCQNEDISIQGQGTEIETGQLAGIMIRLQEMGCHNINLVTPTHQVYAILKALEEAVEAGLRLPLVYNCGGYESVETLKLLDGIVDIYMPDFKFADSGPAEKFCAAPDYPDRAREALIEMHAQVGDLIMDEDGVAQKGLLVRHLVLPDGLAGTREVAGFLAGLSKATYTNIMAQYRPCGQAGESPELDRAITREEHREAVKEAYLAGLTRLDKPRGPSLMRFF